MPLLGSILASVGGLIILVCSILVWVKMFQNGRTGLAILFILLSCCAIGIPITFIYGWIKSTDWNLRNVMLAFTVGFIMHIVGGILNPAQIQTSYQQFQQQLQQQQQPPR
jgi:hypothetical protein